MDIQEDTLGVLFRDAYGLIAHGSHHSHPTVDLSDRIAHENYILNEMMQLNPGAKTVFNDTV